MAREDLVEVTVGAHGRNVAPARRAALERARRRFDVVPASVSLVDELVAERRKQARREEARRAAK